MSDFQDPTTDEIDSLVNKLRDATVTPAEMRRVADILIGFTNGVQLVARKHRAAEEIAKSLLALLRS